MPRQRSQKPQGAVDETQGQRLKSRGREASPGKAAHGVPKARHAGIANIAAEHLVAGVAGEADSDVPAGHFADQEGGHLGGIGEGLVVHGAQTRNDRLGVGGGDSVFGMIGPKMAGDRGGVLGLIELG